MQAEFWHQKWEKGEIAFHEAEPNPLLTRHHPIWNPKAGARIFLPLCGKTRDIAYLLGLGYQVVGVEWSPIAVRDLFEELEQKPQTTCEGPLTRHRAPSLDILVGDFFSLTREILGPVNAVYDRAALIALPQPTRVEYTQHLRSITDGASQLLITVEYDHSLMEGPPFSIEPAEVQKHYPGATHLETREIPGGLKGKVAASETAWRIPSFP